MKGKMKNVVGVVFLIAVIAAVFSLYHFSKDKQHRDLAKKIADLSPRGGVPEGFDGLKKAIALYEDQIEINFEDGVKTASYWKILAVRYTDRGIYNEALKALEQALLYNAEDPTLFYLTGLSAGVLAKAALNTDGNDSEREKYLRMSERAYLRSIELDDAYAKPRYGLGILYSFEFNRPDLALPQLLRYTELMPRDEEGMFALARAYYAAGDSDSAMEIYGRILKESKKKENQAEAQRLRELIQERGGE